MQKRIMNLLAFCLASAACAPALAHDGHGLGGSHWHGTDAWGFVTLALGLGVALWLSKGGK